MKTYTMKKQNKQQARKNNNVNKAKGKKKEIISSDVSTSNWRNNLHIYAPLFL